MSRKSLAVLGAAISGVMAMAVEAAPTPYIGVNFQGGSNGGAPTSLAAGDVAGVFPQANYNNIAGNVGAAIGLNDSSGVATGVSLTFSGAGTWGVNIPTDSPDRRLINGYVDGTDNGTNTYTFSNVPAGNYKVIVYAQPDSSDGRDQSVSLNGGAPIFVSSEAASNFIDTGFVRATGTSLNGPGSVGNYIQFDDVSPVAGQFVITGTSLNFRNFSNGIQIVADPVPEPGTVALLAGVMGVLGIRRRK